MGKSAPIKRVRTTAGNTYSKHERSNGSGYVYRKNGQFCSPQAYSAGAGEVTKGHGTVEADNRRWEPDLTVEAPVPDGDGGVAYEQVRWDKASQLGQMANDSSIRDSIEVNGTTYTQAEIEQAFGQAEPTDGQAVRY